MPVTPEEGVKPGFQSSEMTPPWRTVGQAPVVGVANCVPDAAFKMLPDQTRLPYLVDLPDLAAPWLR